MLPDAIRSTAIAQVQADPHASIDALDRAIVNLAGRISAATYDFLVLVVASTSGPAGLGGPSTRVPSGCIGVATSA